jgi:hypothetical protein
MARWAAGSYDPLSCDEAVARARRAFAHLHGVHAADVAIGHQVSPLVGLVAGSVLRGASVPAPDGDFTSLLFPFLAAAPHCRQSRSSKSRRPRGAARRFIRVHATWPAQWPCRRARLPPAGGGHDRDRHRRPHRRAGRIRGRRRGHRALTLGLERDRHRLTGGVRGGPRRRRRSLAGHQVASPAVASVAGGHGWSVALAVRAPGGHVEHLVARRGERADEPAAIAARAFDADDGFAGGRGRRARPTGAGSRRGCWRRSASQSRRRGHRSARRRAASCGRR